jgi:hypothetical protein
MSYDPALIIGQQIAYGWRILFSPLSNFTDLVPDPEMMIHVVDIYRQSETQDAGGGRVLVPQDQPAYDDVPCCVVMSDPAASDDFERVSVERFGSVFFPVDYGVQQDDLIIFNGRNLLSLGTRSIGDVGVCFKTKVRELAS